MSIRAYAALGATDPLTRFDYEPGTLRADHVEVAVEHCGICHSDLSVLRNEWRNARYPVVAGHEAVGRVVAVGSAVTSLQIGQRVGVSWFSNSCGDCRPCVAGDAHLCRKAEATILGRHGGFAERVQVGARWAVPLPDGLDHTSAGPLFCGGITVFSPLVEFGVKPTDRVGVLGIGGLGHLAVQFLNRWGCEVFAFTRRMDNAREIKALGAHHVISGDDRSSLAALAGTLDFLLVTLNVPQDWNAWLSLLAAHGRMHVVGAVLEPMAIPAFSLLPGQKQVSGSPMGRPSTLATMLDFAARHQIKPIVERYPMSRVNEALAHLESGKARFRVVLDNDFA